MKNITAVIIFTLILVGGIAYLDRTTQVEGSVSVGSEYFSTTTFAGHPHTQRNLRYGSGSLGSVIITGDNTGLLTLYNATTSDVTRRTGNKATSSIVIADFPASTSEGTYTFDAIYTDGLLLITSGDTATGTITYR